MPSPLILPGFIEPDACERVRRAMDLGASEPAELLDEQIELDETVRRASIVEVDDRTMTLLGAKLDSVQPIAARHFGIALTEREGLGLVRYPPGGFFRRHRDRGEVASWPPAARRQIAVVVFLNSSRAIDQEGVFTGGVLRLIEDDVGAIVYLHPQAGTLLAFPATALHEVTPVERGVRDTAIDWFY